MIVFTDGVQPALILSRLDLLLNNISFLGVLWSLTISYATRREEYCG
ncbi:MAG: hypothetical protein PWP64_579 [Candidatus Cloacimonadota bacterium]|nr:hypothetical protein [Candidatus Cloacimonadota bacterium]